MKSDRRVLVVDDDPDIREAIKDTIDDEGYETIEARGGAEALGYLRAHPPPPVILLDWNMAPMNGSEFMEEISKDPTLSNVPVVLLTADARAPEKSKSAHFVGYLKKPVDLGKLFQMLERYCG